MRELLALAEEPSSILKMYCLTALNNESQVHSVNPIVCVIREIGQNE